MKKKSESSNSLVTVVTPQMRVSVLYSLSLLNHCIKLQDHIPIEELEANDFRFVRDLAAKSPLSVCNLLWCCALQPYSFKFFGKLLEGVEREEGCFSGLSASEQRQVYSSLVFMREVQAKIKGPSGGGCETSERIERVLERMGLSSVSSDSPNPTTTTTIPAEPTTDSKFGREVGAILKEVFQSSGSSCVYEEFVPEQMNWSSVDFAFPEKKLAIEVNGPSHYVLVPSPSESSETPTVTTQRPGLAPASDRLYLSKPLALEALTKGGLSSKTDSTEVARRNWVPTLGESNNANIYQLALDGPSLFKYRMLREGCGLRVLPLPFFEWDALERANRSDAGEVSDVKKAKKKLLLEKIKETVVGGVQFRIVKNLGVKQWHGLIYDTYFLIF